MKNTRIIDGKKFKLSAEFRHKDRAKEIQEEKREKGNRVRRIKSGSGTWLLYTRRK